MSLQDVLAKIQDDAKPRLTVREAKNVRLSVKRLREICDANPNHPIAVIKKKSVEAFNDQFTVTIAEAEIEAIVENKELVIEETRTSAKKIFRPKCVAKKAAPTPAKKESDK